MSSGDGCDDCQQLWRPSCLCSARALYGRGCAKQYTKFLSCRSTYRAHDIGVFAGAGLVYLGTPSLLTERKDSLCIDCTQRLCSVMKTFHCIQPQKATHHLDWCQFLSAAFTISIGDRSSPIAAAVHHMQLEHCFLQYQSLNNTFVSLSFNNQ